MPDASRPGLRFRSVPTADAYQRSGLLGLWALGVPFTLKGRARVSIERGANGAAYRVAYWPQENRPPTEEQKAGQKGAGSPSTEQTTTLPLPPK
jgi:hypothetical protein